MAYGNGNKESEKRMVSLGVGELTDTKFHALIQLRDAYLDTANTMMDQVFVREPLAGIPDKKALDTALLAIQKSMKGLNKAYVEKARMAVSDHARESHSRYLRRLVGKLRHCAEEIEGYKGSGRRYYHISEVLQQTVDHADIVALQRKASSWDIALNLYRQVILHGASEALSEGQLKVIRELHETVQSRYRVPVYGRDEGFTCQLHLDYRVIRGLNDGKVLEPLNKAATFLLHDKDNRRYQHFLEVSHPTPRQTPIRLPIYLSEKRLRRLGIDGLDIAFKSFVLEIGTGRIEVKGVVEKSPPWFIEPQAAANASPAKLDDEQFVALAKALNACDALIGRDFGYANTIALTVIKRQHELAESDIRDLMEIRHLPHEKARAAMKDWFASRDGRDIEVVAQQCYSGRNFLSAIQAHCEAIDRLSSQIDRIYLKIEALKTILVNTLALNPDEWIPQSGLTLPDAFVKHLHRKFFHLLEKVNHLKAKRRERYRTIAGLKKSWFGFLTNQEVALAKEHNAAMIREDLTVMAIEKSSPENKGRRFNKMINNGSKGQYIRRASDKHLWNGIPELAVPAPYTSQACLYHGQLGSRKGEVFACPACKETRHSDENAALNIAGMLLTRRTGNSEKLSSVDLAILKGNPVHEKPLPNA